MFALGEKLNVNQRKCEIINFVNMYCMDKAVKVLYSWSVQMVITKE